MKILLDTQSFFLWWLDNNPALSESFREPSEIQKTLIWLKQVLGSLDYRHIKELLALEAFENLALTARQAAAVAELPWHHRDPFDRMLVAQAQVERLTLLSIDRDLAAYGDL